MTRYCLDGLSIADEGLSSADEGRDDIMEEEGCTGCRSAHRRDGRSTYLPEIQRSAEAGCRICEIVVWVASWSYEGLKAEAKEVSDLVSTAISWDEADGSLYLGHKISHSRGSDRSDLGNLNSNVEFCSGRAGESSPFPFVKAAPLIAQPGSEPCFKRLETWISHCAKHPACRVLEKTTLPKRVIDVNTAAPDVVLVETNDEIDKYNCLSYCWGDKLPLKTTRSNLEEHTLRIPFTNLPQTFKDAVKITRRLRVRWLWIDALCILQDDAQDWEVESAKMYDIYRNSWLTISAACAKDISRGCFRDMSVPAQVRVEVRTGEGVSKPIYVRSILPRDDCYLIRNDPLSLSLWWHNTKAHLFSRAWALQERLLSPRVIHFARYEMIWECHSKVMCECTPDDITVQGESLKQLYYKDVSTDQTSINVSSLSWQILSKEYYPCMITYPEDRLPALSGLAKMFHDGKPELGAYMSGLWLSDLPTTLLWWCDFNSGKHLFPEEIHLENRVHLKRQNASPSWSWASIYGDTDRFLLRFALGNDPEERRSVRKSDVIAKVVNTRCIPAGLDTFGATKVGNITLELPFVSIKQGKVEFDNNARGGEKTYVDTIMSGSRVIYSWVHLHSRIHGEWEGCRGYSYTDSYSSQKKWEKDEDSYRHDASFTLDCWLTDSIIPQIRGDRKIARRALGIMNKLACVLVAKAEMPCRICDWDFHWEILGLLLKPSLAHLGCYERVGYVRAREEFFSNPETRVITLV